MNAPSVVIEEILRRANQGMTWPFVCRGDDGALYYVKGTGERPAVLLPGLRMRMAPARLARGYFRCRYS